MAENPQQSQTIIAEAITAEQAWRVRRRRILGVLSVLLLVASAGIQLLQPWDGDGVPMVAILRRVGIVLFATWLALPELEKIPKWMFASLLGGALVCVVRPPLVVVVVPAIILMWSLRGIGKIFV